MDAVGHRYGKRPSELWGLTGDDSLMLSMAFDSEVLRKANEFEQRKMEEARTGKAQTPEAKAERQAATKLSWAKFAETLPDGHPLKEKALKVATEVMG